MTKPSKVLILGSGPIVIGQAAEFDYSGTQACRALREEGVTTVLVNSNPATIMTDEDIADVVYIEPLTVEVVARIIERERPDGLLPTLGGQTGLNLAVALADAGVLEKLQRPPARHAARHDPHGRGPRALQAAAAADRRAGAGQRDRHEHRRGRGACEQRIGLPLVIRPAYTLGGTGGGVAFTDGAVRAHRPGRPRRQPDHARCWSSAASSAGKRSSTR